MEMPVAWRGIFGFQAVSRQSRPVIPQSKLLASEQGAPHELFHFGNDNDQYGLQFFGAPKLVRA
jgi:hypothetical protein